MDTGPAVVLYELRNLQRETEDEFNKNITTGSIGVPTSIDELPEVQVNQEIDRKEETETNLEVKSSVINPDAEIEWEPESETINE